MKSLNENQKFLLDKIFNVSQIFGDTVIENVPQETKHSYACFNGAWGDWRNLEEYLRLIVKLSKPQRVSQYRFYLNIKNEILHGKAIKELLSEHNEFSYSESEDSHEQLWRVIINSLHEFDCQSGDRLITYLLNNIQSYSLFTSKNITVSLRDDMHFFLVKLLDILGWSDQNGKHQDNIEKNIAGIAEWIFGEGRHTGSGVLGALSKEDRGVLGLYDLLMFRLYCSADRGGNHFNLQRALSKHGNPNASTKGLISDIVVEEMREISQNVFQIFKSQYIDQNKNLFDLVDNLSLADLSGRYQSFVQGKIASGEVEEMDMNIGALRSRIKSFITYQLGNSLISFGVGCGYYDPSGKEDKKGIKSQINEYLFNECFNPTKNSKNYEHFVDYLLIHFTSTLALRSGCEFISRIDEFVKVLDREKLADYWKNHADSIRALKLTSRDKTVITVNYKASYKEDLVGVYDVLDKLVQDNTTPSPDTSTQDLNSNQVGEDHKGQE